MDRIRSARGWNRVRLPRGRTSGRWLAGGLLVLAVATVVLLEVWEHPPGWLLGPRRMAVSGLHWMRGHWRTPAGLGVVGLAVVAAILLRFWWQRRGAGQQVGLAHAPRSAEAMSQR